MRFRRTFRRSRYDIRQYSESNVIVTAATGFTVTENVLFAPAAYTVAPSAAHLQKDFTIQIGEWQSDILVESAVVGNAALTCYEFIYLADADTSGLSIYNPFAFSGSNQLAATDPRQLPDRMVFRRHVSLFPIFGSVAGVDFNWHPRRRGVKVRVKPNQALYARLEVLNNGTANDQTVRWTQFAAVAVKANP